MSKWLNFTNYCFTWMCWVSEHEISEFSPTICDFVLEPSVYAPVIKFEDSDIPPDFNDQFVYFVGNTTNRTLANFMMWRISQIALSFTDKDSRNLGEFQRFREFLSFVN